MDSYLPVNRVANRSCAATIQLQSVADVFAEASLIFAFITLRL